jgi:lipoprotein LprG
MSGHRVALCGGIAVAWMLIASACSGDGSGGLPNAQIMLRQATSATRAVSSARITMRSSDGAIPGLSVQSYDAQITRTGDDLAAQTSAVTTLGQHVSFLEVHGKTYVQGSPSSFQLAPAGTGTSLPHPALLIDPRQGISHILATLLNPATVAKQEIMGTPVFKVIGQAPRNALTGIAPGATSDAEVTFWLRTDRSHLPVRTELRFSDGPRKTPTVNLIVTDANKPVTIRSPF